MYRNYEFEDVRKKITMATKNFIDDQIKKKRKQNDERINKAKKLIDKNKSKGKGMSM